ncbi:MAG: 3-oxoacid CoA-transferase subunit B [Myxococcales bacterium]|nr:3-oxoacid CoA-transferase subunit B [Myxococcales bacterium]
MSFTEEEMTDLASREIVAGTIVNLGIGLPTLVANRLPAGSDVWLHTENGILGMGPFPLEGEEDPQIINAGKQTVTVVPGGSCFDSATSFMMIRGGHVDLAILGAMQVSASGDLANWSIPGGKTMGIGGAMDLAAGARRIVVMTRHVTKKGEPKLVSSCTYPLTAVGVVSRVITDLAVLDIDGGAFRIVKLAPGVDHHQLQGLTGAKVLPSVGAP